MSTITGQNIIDRAWIKAQDTNGGSGIRWPAEEALRWLNDGQREVVNVLPSSYTLAAQPDVVASSTRQTLAGLNLPAGIRVIDVPRNIAAGGAPGRAITLRKREWFDDQRPNWHAEVANDALHYTFDERDPKAFFLYPAKSSGKVEVIYSAAPADLPNLAALITLDDIYANALQFFVLFSFYSKDATYTQAPAKAGGYYQLFLQSLGVKANAELANAMAGMAKSSAGVTP